MIMRHNNLRDVNAEFQKEFCHDVKVEPMLIPIEGENTQIEGAKEDGAHPDISSRGLKDGLSSVEQPLMCLSR